MIKRASAFQLALLASLLGGQGFRPSSGAAHWRIGGDIYSAGEEGGWGRRGGGKRLCPNFRKGRILDFILAIRNSKINKLVYATNCDS